MGARPNVSPKREEANVELDVSQEIGQILDEFATRFGASGAELWAELVRYEVASVIASAIISSIVLLTAFYTMRKLWAHSQSDEVSDEEPWVIGSVVAGIVCIIFMVITLVSSFDLVVTLAAPQAATLKGLLP